MAKYVYPAVFTQEDVGGFSIHFPDVPGCFTQGEDLADGLEMAKDALELMLYDFEEDGEPMPTATPLDEVVTEGKAFATLVAADTLHYRKMYQSKAVRKNVTIPGWLANIADSENVNISNVLQRALKAELNITQ